MFTRKSSLISISVAILISGCGVAQTGNSDFPYELEVVDQTLAVDREIVLHRVRVDQPSLVVVFSSSPLGIDADFDEALSAIQVSAGTEVEKIVTLKKSVESGELLHAYLIRDVNDNGSYEKNVDAVIRDENTHSVSASFRVYKDINTLPAK